MSTLTAAELMASFDDWHIAKGRPTFFSVRPDGSYSQFENPALFANETSEAVGVLATGAGHMRAKVNGKFATHPLRIVCIVHRDGQTDAVVHVMDTGEMIVESPFGGRMVNLLRQAVDLPELPDVPLLPDVPI